ncbi:hypothetical protein X953_00825 [Virgibacillus sp. SK37]|nr:hypothetical protein X953_00825 [Virgibacillus sp. SK37]
MYIASKWDYQGLSVESAAELYQSQVLFILRRAVLSAAGAFYPPESCFITRRSLISAGEPIYPPQKPFIRRRAVLSPAEALYPPENRFLSAAGAFYPPENRFIGLRNGLSVGGHLPASKPASLFRTPLYHLRAAIINITIQKKGLDSPHGRDSVLPLTYNVTLN